MKSAASLPRFALDCGFWRTRRYAGASPAVVGLQTAAVSYCHEHGTDGWIPDDGLAAALGFKERDVAKLVPEMLRRNIWTKADGGLVIVGYLDHNPSRAQVQKDRHKRALAGQKANHERWHQDRSDSDCEWCVNGSDVGSESDSDMGSEADSQEKTREEKTREEKTNGVPSPPGFDAFWTVYPSKVGKGAARRAWAKAVKAAGGFEAIIAGAERFAADPNREDAFTPHASTWLNAERWDDPPLPARLDRNGHQLVPVNPSLSEWERR